MAFVSFSLLLVSIAAMGADPPGPNDAARKQQLSHYGGGAMLIEARELDLAEVMGKSLPTNKADKPVTPGRLGRGSDSIGPVITLGNSDINDGPDGSPNNVAIRNFPNVSEDEPMVAANPKRPNRVVMGSHFIGDTANRCIAHYSSDGGQTWNVRPIFMPQLTHRSQCSDPVLAYAPDGSRVYYAYIDLKSTQFDIVVSYSDDDGKTWKGPIVALTNVTSDYDKPWIGTHVSGAENQSNSNLVYVTATRFDNTPPFPCNIEFTRSSNKGLTWSAPQSLESSVGGCGDGTNPVVQGSRPAGGPGGAVLVAWYNSGTDGFLKGSFEIHTRYSANNGATFGPPVVATVDASELPFWLGPSAAYHRWWGGMFPSIAIAQNGNAHIAYTADPVPGSATPEDGDIRYSTSAGPPYAAWSAPVTLNDDHSGKAQGWVALAATSSGSTTTVFAIWEDHRNSATDNRNYDVFFTKKTGAGWSPNQKVTDAQSTSDFIFLGDYYGITAVRGNADDDESSRFVYGVWTDRRNQPTPFDFDDDVWGARLPTGSNGNNTGNP